MEHPFYREAEKNIDLIATHLPSMEAAETHSMSMEFFATPWYGLFFKHQTKKYEVSHLEGTLNFIPYGCLVDHFLFYIHVVNGCILF